MDYFTYLTKKTIKNKKNLYPLLLLFIGIFGMYWLNIYEGGHFGFQERVAQYHEAFLENEEYYLGILEDSEEYTDDFIEAIEAALEDTNERLSWLEESLEAVEEENWELAYSNRILLNERLLYEHENEGEGRLLPEEAIEVLSRENLLYENLAGLNIEISTDGYETMGVNFIYRVMFTLFPFFIILIILVYLTELFISPFKEDKDIERLFPQKYTTIMNKRVLFGVVFSIVIYMTSVFLSGVVGTLFHQFGTLEYPMVDLFHEVIPIRVYILQMGILQVLSIIMVTLIVALISLVTKSKLITLLLTIVVGIGIPLILRFVDVFNGILHLIPFTFLMSGEVVSNQLAYEKGNSSISFCSGVIVLALFSFSLFVVLRTYTANSDRSTEILIENIG